MTEGLKAQTEKSQLERLSENTGPLHKSDLDLPLDNFEKVNNESKGLYNRELDNNLDESISKYEIYAKDAPLDGLSDSEKQELKERTGWPDDIIDACRTMDEANVYIEAGLEPETIDGKNCLIKSEIDPNLECDGETNLERMSRGCCPISQDGQKIELHHIGQDPDSPLAELTTEEHRGEANDMILHDKTNESNIDRATFRRERESYWIARAEQIKNQNN